MSRLHRSLAILATLAVTTLTACPKPEESATPRPTPSPTPSPAAKTTPPARDTTQPNQPAPKSTVGQVVIEKVTTNAPELTPGAVEAFLRGAGAQGIQSCVEKHGALFQSGSGSLAFMVFEDGSSGKHSAARLGTFGPALAGCIFFQVITPHRFPPWKKQSAVEVVVQMRFERTKP